MTCFRLAVVALAAFLPVAAPVAAQPFTAQPFTAEQRGAIEVIVRDYLVRHPEVIIEAVDELQQRERTAEERKAQTALAEKRGEIYSNDADPIGGNPKGDVTVVEFFDYQCGYCKTVQPEIQALLKDDTGIRFVFKEFPILGPASVTAAHAALAARAQGKYIEMHNALMGHRGALDEATIMKLAAGVGLDVERLKKDMASPAVQQAIGANLALADQLGVRGTPAFVFGERIVPGAIKIADMKGLIAKMRKG